MESSKCSFIVWKEKISFFSVHSWEKFTISLSYHDASGCWVVKVDESLTNNAKPEEMFLLDAVRQVLAGSD